MNPRLRKTLFATHKWLGLAGGAWLVVLGLTGLMLDHRDDWGWAWRVGISDRWIPEETVTKLATRHVTLAQANPENANEWVVGGPNGLWHSADGAKNWSAIEFEGLATAPMVYAIVADEFLGWQQLWLASDDGLWSLNSNPGSMAQRSGMQGRRITALDNGAVAGELLLVEDRTHVHLKHSGGNFSEIGLGQAQVLGLPDRVSWSRFIFDLHLGRALFHRPVSMAINDFGALAFVLLPISGFLAWYFARRWRGKRGPALKTRNRIFRSIYRIHAPVLGLLALIPLAYLSLTGIVMDHRGELVMPLARNTVSRTALPPVYDFGSLDQEISHIVAYPGQPGRFTIGTRLGVLTTVDGGKNFHRELGDPAAPGFVWALKRLGDQLFLGGLGGPSYSRQIDEEQWSMVPGLRGMPSDVTLSDDALYVISGPTMLVGDLQNGFSARPFSLPQTDSKPLMLLMFEIHNGKIIHPGFRWVLDALAILTLLMVITGPILWWKRKW